MKKLLISVILGYLGYLLFATSCANIGTPTGGDKDTIAPVVVKTVPVVDARNYRGKTVNITFDEFIISTEVSQDLVVSPPIAKRPTIKTKSKTLIVDFGEQLKPNTTYSLDFRNSIADNNEKNPLNNFRFSFSNGPALDSLMVGGYVRMAENMEPVEDALVLLHRLDSLSAFTDSVPDYIARTDEEGFFMISNIGSGAYKLYALQDADNSMTYNSKDELIAFVDSLIVPEVPFLPDSAMTVHLEALADSLGDAHDHEHDHEQLGLPTEITPFYLLMFQEVSFDQYLMDSKRERPNLCQFVFENSLTDSFRISLLNEPVKADWGSLEFSAKRDSVNLWIRDTVLAGMDTLKFQLNYQVLDSMENFVMQTDTIDLYYEKPQEKERKRKKDDEQEEKKVPHFSFRGNGKDGYDIYRRYTLTSPEPLEQFDVSAIHLSTMVDTVETPLKFDFIADSTNLTKFYIDYRWEFAEEYMIRIDSAAAFNISGNPSNELKQKIKVRDEGYYAKVILTISNLRGPSLIQLLKNTEKEEVVQQIAVAGDGEIEFPYLNPDKFKIRLIIDRNENGKWDTGDLAKGQQPERVVYFPKILKLRSNFEIRENWNLPGDLNFEKDIIDEDDANKDPKKKGSGQQAGRRPGSTR